MLPKANRAMTVLIYVMKAAKVTLERACQEDQDWEAQQRDLFSELIRKAVGEKDDCISRISKTMYIPRLCSYAWTLDWSISHLCQFGM